MTHARTSHKTHGAWPSAHSAPVPTSGALTRPAAPAASLPLLHARPQSIARVCRARELFSDFFVSLFGYPLTQLLADSPAPASAQLLYSQMMRDILGGGGHDDPLAQVRLARVPRAVAACAGAGAKRKPHIACHLAQARARARSTTPTRLNARYPMRRPATRSATTWPSSTWPTMRRPGCWTASGTSTAACCTRTLTGSSSRCGGPALRLPRAAGVCAQECVQGMRALQECVHRRRARIGCTCCTRISASRCR